MYTIVIPGDPFGKQRHRVAKHGIKYTPKKTAETEIFVRKCFVEQNPNYEPLEGYIRATITCYYRIPKSASKEKKEKMRKGIIRPSKKPDLDNVEKLILDALNEIAYKDDSHVVELSAIKFYDDDPFTKVIIEEL